MGEYSALVTGGVRGIGLSIANRLAARGVRVAAGYSRDTEAAKRFLALYEGQSCTVHQGNIGDPADCERVVAEVIVSPEEWDRVIQVNVSGAFYLSRAVLQHMIDRGYGRIINISSVIGERGNIGQANYAAAKSGLFGLTKSLALETARKGITVNCVTPGFVSTEMVATMPPQALERVLAQIPVGRLAEPDEIARVVEFLADPASGYITGEIYGINGGYYM